MNKKMVCVVVLLMCMFVPLISATNYYNYVYNGTVWVPMLSTSDGQKKVWLEMKNCSYGNVQENLVVAKNFSVDSSDFFVNSNTGKVGIGTGTPSSVLDVVGDVEVSGNVTLGQKITFALGEIIDNIVDGWIRITGGLNVSGDLEVGGNVNVTENLNVNGNITSSGINYSMIINPKVYGLISYDSTMEQSRTNFAADHTDSQEIPLLPGNTLRMITLPFATNRDSYGFDWQLIKKDCYLTGIVVSSGSASGSGNNWQTIDFSDYTIEDGYRIYFKILNGAISGGTYSYIYQWKVYYTTPTTIY